MTTAQPNWTDVAGRIAQLAGETGVGGYNWAVSAGDQTHSGAGGHLDPDAGAAPMPANAIFRISSVTKPVTAVAALQAVEAGLIGLDDPIDTVIGELADRRVLRDPHGSLDQECDDASRPLSVRDLLTFRCGLGMEFDFSSPQPVLEQMWEWGIGPGPGAPEHSPQDYLNLLAKLPLSDQPGVRWRYHTGSDILGILLERLHGEDLDAILARDIFEPLGMSDTAFWVPPDKRYRFAAARMPEDGVMRTWDAPDGRWSQRPQFRSGAAGLVSTTADLITFGQALLAGGAGILKRESVQEMTRDQLDPGQRAEAKIDEGSDALGWGLGLAVRHIARGTWPPPGSYGWDGGLGSRWLVDPAAGVCAVLLTTDAFDSPSGTAMHDAFTRVVGDAVAG